MSTDRLRTDPALEALLIARQKALELRDKLDSEIRRYDVVIAQLQHKDPVARAPVSAGQYAKTKAADAVFDYLQRCGEGPVPFQWLVDDLRRGGCEPEWTEARYPRSLKIMFQAGGNRDRFYYNDQADTVELRTSKSNS